MKVLINLVGGQPAPVYIGIMLINPDKVILVYSEDSKVQLDRIKKTLRHYNYEDVNVSPYDYEDCREKIKNVLEKYKENEIILNVTSGTKIMSMAAFRLFDESEREIFYIDSQNHNLIKISGGAKSANTPLTLAFSIENYFSIYGYPIEICPDRFKNDEDFRKIRNAMSKYYFQIKNIISDINKQIFDKKTLIESKDASGQCYLRYNYKKSNGILNISQGREKISIQITSIDHLDYIIGYWFEDYIFEKLKTSNLFDDIEKNIKIYSLRDNLNPEYINELDICGIKNQTLYIFECKTGNIDKKIVEKLRLIKTITGTYTKIHLVTLFKPLESVALERLKDFNIKLITFGELGKFIENFNNEDNTNPNL